MSQQLLVHVADDGGVFVNESRVEWLAYRNGKLYVREHPGAVYKNPAGHYFLRSPLSLTPWDILHSELAVATALSMVGEVNTSLTLGYEDEMAPALSVSGDVGSVMKLYFQGQEIASMRIEVE